MKKAQLSFEKYNNKVTHGGEKSRGKRKTSRPLDKKRWRHHQILKSSHAKGDMSFIKAKAQIKQILTTNAKKYGVQLGDLAIVGNHLHIKLKFHTRELYKKFSKATSSQIANLITGARKGQAFRRKFWDFIPYTRILLTSFEEWQLWGYFEANRIEVEQGYEARENFLKKHNAKLRRKKRPHEQGKSSKSNS